MKVQYSFGQLRRQRTRWTKLYSMWFIALIKKKKSIWMMLPITRDHFYPLPYNDGKTKYQYVVTALDRLHNESKGTKKKVKL